MDTHGTTTSPDFGADDIAGEEAVAPTPSYLLLKKRLSAGKTRFTAIASELANLDPTSTIAPTAGTAAVLASVEVNMDLSTFDVESLGEAFSAAKEGKLNGHCKLALKITGEEIDVLEAAYKALLAMDAAGKRTLPEWSNYSSLILARAINRQAHAFFRGRLPGWKD